MRPPADVPPPEGPELRAAGLAAFAEAGIVYLPAHLLLSDIAEMQAGITAGAPVFVLAYVLGVLLACRFRASPRTTAIAGVLAPLAGAWLGRADVAGAVLGVVVGLLVALRAVTLALRDWREPVFASIGVGAVVLGTEVLFAAGAVPAWRTPLLAFVPAFFVGALGSRVVTVWASSETREAEPVRSTWVRRAALVMLGLGAGAAGAALLAVRGGVLERIGGWLSPAGNVVLSAFVAVVAFVARPILWALNAVGVDPESVRRALEEWRKRVDLDGVTERATRPGTSWSSRLFGLLVFVAIAWLLYRSLRRLRADVGAYERVDRREDRSRGVPLPEDEPSTMPRPPFRRALPSDTIRRWYAEALLALRDRGLPKEPSTTPAELLPKVAEGFPETEDGFRRLTRLYEDVRYGNRHVSGDVVHALEPEIRQVLAALRRTA